MRSRPVVAAACAPAPSTRISNRVVFPDCGRPRMPTLSMARESRALRARPTGRSASRPSSSGPRSARDVGTSTRFALELLPIAAPRWTEAIRMSASRRLSAVLVALLSLSASSFRARAADAPPPLDKKLRSEIINGTCTELERAYVEADTAKLIANVLRKKLKSGAYDKYTDRSEFAQAVTTDLRSLNGDLHLSLRPGGGTAGAGAGPVIQRRVIGGPDSTAGAAHGGGAPVGVRSTAGDRKSTRLNSSHGYTPYAVFF